MTTTHIDARFTRYGFAAAVCGTLMFGLVIGSAMWPKATATTASPGIEIAALMSSVDVANLPATEIADLF